MSLNDNPFNDNIKIVTENKCNHCDKDFSTLSGLWKHRKTCYIEHQVPSESHTLNKGAKLTVGSSDIPIELILEVIKQSKEVQNVLIEQNKELQKQLLEQNEKMLEQNDKHHKEILEIANKPNVINNNNNSNNKTSFNLQFFLNETCKDAMNIVDFVNSLKLTNNDFETTGKLGFVNGISRIFINNLKKMDVITRPLHCTDVKRETVYIKDNDTWEKDNEEKKKLNWAVNRIAQLNLNQIQQWQQEFPDSVKNNTPANEKFTELALAALGGRDMEEIHKYNDKIMKNVLKEVILSREP
jgi:glutaredoxin